MVISIKKNTKKINPTSNIAERWGWYVAAALGGNSSSATAGPCFSDGDFLQVQETIHYLHGLIDHDPLFGTMSQEQEPANDGDIQPRRQLLTFGNPALQPLMAIIAQIDLGSVAMKESLRKHVMDRQMIGMAYAGHTPARIDRHKTSSPTST